MSREEQLAYLIRSLAPEARLPESDEDMWRLFRTLVNIREPGPIGDGFLRVQDDLLQREIARKGITDSAALPFAREPLVLWQGDITTLRADAIVNAANSGLTGCYHPLHGCIDNAIHTYAGVQLRLECAELIERQGHPEPVGQAKITRAYNLPSRAVLHTVGPFVSGLPTEEDRRSLASCYRACLRLAAEKGMTSVAFCCLSTGEYHFPNKLAAQIAVGTVEACLKDYPGMRVIFNVFKEEDRRLYQELLGI